MTKRQQNLAQYASDMLTVERHVLEAVERQASSDEIQKYPDAQRVVGRIKTTLAGHTRELEAYLEGRDDDSFTASLKEALGSILGVAAGLYDKVRNEDKVSRMLRDDYTALSLTAVSYHMLYTTALGLRDVRLQQIALDNLKDISPLVVDLSKAICRVVARELTDEGKIDDPTVGDTAVRRTQEAWSGKVTDPAG